LECVAGPAYSRVRRLRAIRCPTQAVVASNSAASSERRRRRTHNLLWQSTAGYSKGGRT
jgi:hypothetical protein